MTNTNSNFIIIADDHPLFCQALRETIAPIFKQAEICELETLQETLDNLAKHEVTLLLLDLHMPDSQGLTGLMMIKGLYPALPVIIVSASEEPETVRAAIQAGAAGYLFKSYSLTLIHDAIKQVISGDVHVPKGIEEDVSVDEQKDLTAISQMAELTPAQLRVYMQISQGLMNKQIAAQMNISEATVKAHVTAVYKKLGVRSRTQAVLVSVALKIGE